MSSAGPWPGTKPATTKVVDAAIVARFPDREALVVPDLRLRYTYAEFNDAVDAVARGLLAKGLSVGDRIGIWSPNDAE